MLERSGAMAVGVINAARVGWASISSPHGVKVTSRAVWVGRSSATCLCLCWAAGQHQQTIYSKASVRSFLGGFFFDGQMHQHTLRRCVHLRQTHRAVCLCFLCTCTVRLGHPLLGPPFLLLGRTSPVPYPEDCLLCFHHHPWVRVLESSSLPTSLSL